MRVKIAQCGGATSELMEAPWEHNDRAQSFKRNGSEMASQSESIGWERDENAIRAQWERNQSALERNQSALERNQSALERNQSATSRHNTGEQ